MAAASRTATPGFASLTVIPPILLVAWFLPGLPLLLAGAFLPVPMVLIAAPLAVALGVNGLRRMPSSWPGIRSGPDAGYGLRALWGLLGTVVVAGGFAFWQFQFNSEALIVVRSPAAYLQAGYWIAQHGSLPIPVSLSAFGGAHAALGFSSIGFFAGQGRVIPGMVTGLPMLLAGGFWVHGLPGAAALGPVLGALAVLCFGGLAGRLVGPGWAPAAAAVLAMTLPQQYTSRGAFVETSVQILLFGGLSLVVDALTMARRARSAEPGGLARRPAGPGEDDAAGTAALAMAGAGVAGGAGLAAGPGIGEPGPGADPAAGPDPAPATAPAGPGGTALLGKPVRPLRLPALPGWPRPPREFRMPGWLRPASRSGEGRPAAGPRPRVPEGTERRGAWLTPHGALAVLGGLALGMSALVSVQGLVYILPVIPFAGALVVGRRATWAPFCIACLIGIAYGVAAAVLLARPYLSALAPVPVAVGAIAAWLLALTIAAVQVLRYERPRCWTRKVLTGRPLRWLPGVGAALVAAALIGLAVRPYVQTVRGQPSLAVGRFIASLQRQQGLMVAPGRLYAEDTLYWVIWYAGVPAVLLGGLGAMLLVRRALRAMITWQDPTGAARNWALALAVILWGSAVVLWQPDVVPDQPWASRRLVPLVLPGLLLCAIWAAGWLAAGARERGAARVTSGLVGAFCAVALLVPSAATAFGAGLSHAGKSGGLRLVARGMALHRTGQGEDAAVARLCSAIGRSAAVVIVDRVVAEQFTQVIRGMCGVPAGWMVGQPAAAVDSVLARIAAHGRRPVLLAARPSQLAGFGGSPVRVLSLVTAQAPHQLTQPPGGPVTVRYDIWMVAQRGSGSGV
jgi:hypothetical protein